MTDPIEPIKGGSKRRAADIARQMLQNSDMPTHAAERSPSRPAASPAMGPTKSPVKQVGVGAQDAYAANKDHSAIASENFKASSARDELGHSAEAGDNQVKASIQDAFKQWAQANGQKADAASWPQFSASFIGKLQQAGVSQAAAQEALDDAAPSASKRKGENPTDDADGQIQAANDAQNAAQKIAAEAQAARAAKPT